MRAGFIGAFIGVLVSMAALGAIAWNIYTGPSADKVESYGLQNIMATERASISNYLNSGFAD